MPFDDGASARAATPTAWVEVTGPISDALGVLAKAIQQSPDTLAGASIGVTVQETLLLNERAWALFADALETLPGLATRPAPSPTRPIRFLLIASRETAPDAGERDSSA